MIINGQHDEKGAGTGHDPNDLLGIKGQAARLIEIMRDAIDGEDSKRQDTQADQREAPFKVIRNAAFDHVVLYP